MLTTRPDILCSLYQHHFCYVVHIIKYSFIESVQIVNQEMKSFYKFILDK